MKKERNFYVSVTIQILSVLKGPVMKEGEDQVLGIDSFEMKQEREILQLTYITITRLKVVMPSLQAEELASPLTGIPSKRDDCKSVEEELEDDYRIVHILSHLNAVKEAMKNGVDVKGFFIWSLMDNMEMGLGYNVRFGLNHVDCLDNLKRSFSVLNPELQTWNTIFILRLLPNSVSSLLKFLNNPPTGSRIITLADSFGLSL
ncbi:Glycoside hydrolase family 1 [Dillenia turbinata]|uniref:Glycoside hydrolase family 1 n=1 Tax=Dillenia turbinata TaxID=194707 RepID=A0AAN8V733_9MAGN